MKHFNEPIKSVIKKRHSVRTYSNQAIAPKLLEAITGYIKEVEMPYKGQVRMQILSKEEKGEQVKLGTYGVIKGASYYIGAVCKKGEDNRLVLGYALEKVVLFCTAHGLGTVWLGGTFSKSQFAKVMQVQEDEELVIVTPIGYEAEKKSFIAALMGNNTNKRKAFGEVFFDGNRQTPLTEQTTGKYAEALEMLRCAPSAMNMQPWRVVKENEKLHFYMVNTRSFSEIDMGIALAHFHLTAQEQGIEGKFVRENLDKEESMTYIVSWV